MGRPKIRWEFVALGFLFATAALTTACAVPRHSLLLSTAPLLHAEKKVRPIPADWDGRILQIGDGLPVTGGEASHIHSFAHRHSLTSGPATASDRPLGLTNTGASATHVHLVESQSQSTLQTGPATNIPPSRELLGSIARKSFLHVWPGLIVGFIGTAPPVGWQLCDGSNGSPDLRGLYLMLKRDRRTDSQQGENAPRHDASHSHTWGVAATDSQVGTNWGFFGGPNPVAQPDFNVAGLSHTHTASEPEGWSGQTDVDDVPPRPPSMAVTFIQATATARKMPAGALIAFTGESIPGGWSSWTAQGGTNVIGRFPVGPTTDRPAGTAFGLASHRHKVTMTHTIVVAASADVGTGVRRDDAPAMAVAAHTHAASSRDPIPVETGPASQIPPFVAVRFIVKR
jgi:hypothetical protein